MKRINKKGFTLVELLSTITIMSIVALMVSVNAVGLLDEKQEEARVTNANIIEEAACVYIELDENKDLKNNCLTNGCELSTNKLIKRGLLDEGDVSKELIINIKKINNQKVCKLKES